MVASVLLAVGLGVLIGYSTWGTTASVVEIVERQLSRTQTRIEALEKRMGALERKGGGEKVDTSAFISSPFGVPDVPSNAPQNPPTKNKK
ncbi:MAG: hypothetical protein FJ145_21950 [Deltaproteobacteria bacterium]|nr:hypothetical protein [Deltaproteobacteria bacterium]